MTRFSGECSACPLLLDVLPELHKLPRGVVFLRHTEVVAFVVIPQIDVETFATWATTLVVKVVAIVRATGEAVVTCGHEVSHGTGITEPGEIPTGVGIVFFPGTCGSRG
jgi:hypothetical protein